MTSKPDPADQEAMTPEAEHEDAPMDVKKEASEFFRTAVIAVILAVIIRSLLFEPFNIPSGSMKPTLQVGDYIFVNKPSYGYSRFSFPFGFAPIEDRVWSAKPQRGDVVVFKLPTNTSIDFIKRIVGMPGDTIQMRGGRLFLNGEMIERKFLGLRTVDDQNRGLVEMAAYEQTLPGGATYTIYEESDEGPLDNTDVYEVPPGHYFMMGDNRDNSQDSRVKHVVGYVPFNLLVGRADMVFFSINETASLLRPWAWPWAVRYDRLIQFIGPDRAEATSEEPTESTNRGE